MSRLGIYLNSSVLHKWIMMKFPPEQLSWIGHLEGQISISTAMVTTNRTIQPVRFVHGRRENLELKVSPK
jgi:hypothetical protein